jgi:hypothetical protein
MEFVVCNNNNNNNNKKIVLIACSHIMRNSDIQCNNLSKIDI